MASGLTHHLTRSHCAYGAALADTSHCSASRLFVVKSQAREASEYLAEVCETLFVRFSSVGPCVIPVLCIQESKCTVEHVPHNVCRAPARSWAFIQSSFSSPAGAPACPWFSQWSFSYHKHTPVVAGSAGGAVSARLRSEVSGSPAFRPVLREKLHARPTGASTPSQAWFRGCASGQ